MELVVIKIDTKYLAILNSMVAEGNTRQEAIDNVNAMNLMKQEVKDK